jgi:hypothetical protein
MKLTALLACLIALFVIGCGEDEDVPAGVSGGSQPVTGRPTRTPASGTTLFVGEGERFRRISDAVVAAEEGASVLVRAGVYPEEVEITKPLTLEAFGDGPAIIDGECERENGIRIPSGSDIRLRGLQVQDVRGAGVLIGNGPPDSPPERVTVEGMRISDFNCQEADFTANAGIAAWYTGCCITLRDNIIVYRSTGDLRGMGNGIWFKSNSEHPSGGGHLITGNVIKGGWDGIGGESEDDPHGSFDRDTAIEGNRVSGCWDDGIQVEGGNADVTVRANYVEGCGTGIAVAPTLTGPLYVEGNVIRDLVIGLYENLFCFKVGDGGSGTVYLTRNTCATEGDGISQTNQGLSPIVARNNCFRVTRYVFELGDAGDHLDFAGDQLWTEDRDRFIEWGGMQHGSLREFQAGEGQEQGGVQSPDCAKTEAD